MNPLKKVNIQNIAVMVFFLVILIIPFFAFAGDQDTGANDEGNSNAGSLGKVTDIAKGSGYDTDATESSLADVISNVIKGFLSILGVIFLILIIYAGYLWMNAQGNEDQVKKAKDTLRNAIIGIIIVVAAYAITAFVFGALGK